MKKLFRNLLFVVLVISLFACVKKKEVFEKTTGPNDKNIRIVFTNDIHCGFNENLGMAKLKKYYDEITDYKLLVDAGDFSQGDSMGTINNGQITYELMNAMGYDFIIPGNHEFDRKVPSFLNSSIELTGKMFCCNFYDIQKKELVFDPYKIFRLGNKNVALIGVLTPDTIKGTSYKYFQDKNNNYVYSFMQEDGLEGFSANIQKYIDEARNCGADYVVLVMHVGDIATSVSYKSEDIVAHLNGIDAVIDGHSHNKYNYFRKDKDGKDIPIAQTGTKMESIGDLTIDKNGNVSISLIDSVEGTNEEADKIIKDAYKKMDDLLSEVIKKDVPFVLTTEDPTTGKRIIRNSETNLGDLCADALRYAGKSDVAIINGGGIRSSIDKGDIKVADVYKVFPFSNTVSTVLVSGKTLKDIIEFGLYAYPVENGTFFQVSGLTFDFDTTKDRHVIVDNDGIFKSVDGEYRVKNMLINGQPLDESKMYTLTTINYFTENFGSGCSMFEGLEAVEENIAFDADILYEYIKQVDIDKYKNVYGDGRINIIVE